MAKKPKLTTTDLFNLQWDLTQLTYDLLQNICIAVENKFKQGEMDLPDIAFREYERFSCVKTILNTFKLLGIETRLPFPNHDIYLFEWTDIYNVLSYKAQAQWRSREDEIIHTTHYLTAELKAFRKKRKKQ